MSDATLFLDTLDAADYPASQAPQPGFSISAAEVAVSWSHQQAKLTACGIDPEIFGQHVDPAFFIGIGIEAGMRCGISSEGNVNMLQRLIQRRPVELGEVLVVKGQIEAVEPVPRGMTVQTNVWFEDAQGHRVIDASRTSLRPDPAKRGARGAGDRPPPVIETPNQTHQLNAHQLTSQRVKDYSMEGNSIHYDEAAAQRAGFRAPMIGGGMGVHYLNAELWKAGPPKALDLDIYFRRPIFWDEAFTAVRLGPEPVHDWQALALLRDEREKGLKVLTELRINSIELQAE